MGASGRLHRRIATVACLTTLAACAAAPPVRLARTGPPERAPVQAPQPEPLDSPWHVGVFGFHLDDRIGPAIAGGVARRVGCAPADTCDVSESNVFLSLEPGWGGGRASLGFAYQRGGMGFLTTLRGSYLQRWSHIDNSYAGVELSVHPKYFVGIRAGFFSAIRDEAYPDRLTILGLALGF